MTLKPYRPHACPSCGEATSGDVRSLCPPCADQRAQAWRALNRARRNGQITRPASCQACHRSDVGHLHGHHHRGYARADWLNVLWLCVTCHNRAHQGAGNSQLVNNGSHHE